MKRTLGILLTAAALGLGAAPAYADHGGYGYEDDCRGGGCGNEREESYEGAGCKYVCPSFKDSPVHDAFNFSPQICLPGATCHFEDRERQGEGGQQPPAS